MVFFSMLHFLSHILGLGLAGHAIMTIKKAPSAVAWSLGLIGIPLGAIPLYLFLGRGRFRSYIEARRQSNKRMHDEQPQSHMIEDKTLKQRFTPHQADNIEGLENITRSYFSPGNKLELLINGEATYDTIFKALEKANDYIMVQFYIVRDDELGRRFKAKIKEKAESGVRVYFLYDEMGCLRLSSSYWEDIKASGVNVCSFNAARGPDNLLHINFRNHRKTLVIDGKTAFVGGHNLGDEYLGKDPEHSPWRDTHLQLTGPAVNAVQMVFIEDWYWAASFIPEMSWVEKKPEDKGPAVLVAGTGPADTRDEAILLYLEIIKAARSRLWLVSPYFVPDQAILNALQSACMRGVDVRLLLPGIPDKLLVWLASYTFYEDAQDAGIKLYRYNGFLHQKVALVDDYLAIVGTGNIDNRSFSLNFELNLLVADKEFARQIETMLDNDFANSACLVPHIFNQRPFYFRFSARLARLFSPIL